MHSSPARSVSLLNQMTNNTTWRFSPTPDIKSMQCNFVTFSQKRDRSAHLLLYFNRSEVVLKQEQKHLGMILDSELNFHCHAKEKVVSARKAIGVIRFMS